jgi:threonine aldolase
MKNIEIDLYSDTITKPTQGMRRAISSAEVGDEQQKEDPTVNKLTEMVCDLMRKEDAIFLPSGTMCNQIAFRVYCRPGDEIIMDETAHTRHYETGGPSALSGATMYPIKGRRGIFDANQVIGAIREQGNHFPRSRVLLVEQTSNLGGGTIWPLKTIQEVCDVAHLNGLACHMDGARLLNAVASTGISANSYSNCFDSVWIDFSKGLGAPVGAALAGSKEFINEAWRWKHQLGGAMRQAGIIAAGAVYALEHNVGRLSEDHENAEIIADRLKKINGVQVLPYQTNMVFFDIAGLNLTAEELNSRMMDQGVRFSVIGDYILRAVTHLDITREKINKALSIFEDTVMKL